MFRIGYTLGLLLILPFIMLWSVIRAIEEVVIGGVALLSDIWA